MALFRLFFNIFPVLTSLSFAKSFLACGVAADDDGIHDNGKVMIKDNDKPNFNNNNKTKMMYFQQSTDKDDNLDNLCGQLKKLLDLPAVLFSIILIQLISFVLVLNIEECSPLVLFSWWRNKIS